MTKTPTILEPPHARMETVACLPTVELLRQFVLQTLCGHDHLDPDQTPLWQAAILRKGKPCGLFFEVQGPRLLKNHAVWAGQEHRILFYTSTGERFAITRLSESPDPRTLKVSPPPTILPFTSRIPVAG